jgi:hypothetical protein
LIHKDVINELKRIQEVEDRPLEMCMDVPFDLKPIKLITQLIGLNGKGLLQLARHINLMKDGKRSSKITKENDVHVEWKRVDMLTQKDVSLKDLNLFKRKSELVGVSGKSIININKPIASEVDEMGMTLDKEESTCLKNSPMAKQKVLPQKMNVEQMEKENGQL